MIAFQKGNIALHMACLAGQVEVVRILLEHKSDVNAQSQVSFTILTL